MRFVGAFTELEVGTALPAGIGNKVYDRICCMEGSKGTLRSALIVHG